MKLAELFAKHDAAAFNKAMFQQNNMLTDFIDQNEKNFPKRAKFLAKIKAKHGNLFVSPGNQEDQGNWKAAYDFPANADQDSTTLPLAGFKKDVEDEGCTFWWNEKTNCGLAKIPAGDLSIWMCKE